MNLTEFTEDMLPERYEPNWEKLTHSKSEAPHMEASFYLLRETAHWVSLVSSIHVAPITERNLAVNRGMLVRLAKLTRLLVRDLAAKESFQQMAVNRSVLETVATLLYLLGDAGNGERYDQYIASGLIAERELLTTILENIEKRNGIALPIEMRMQRSIKKAAAAAGVDDVSAIPGRGKIGYPSIEARIKLLGDTVYDSYRQGSVEVHGDWNDLYRNHLTYQDGVYSPRLEDYETRPQLPLATSMLVISTVGQNVGKLLGSTDASFIAAFEEPLKDLGGRVVRLDRAHEALMQQQG
ncbi:DUF5677 domain-containing protein [Actinokineospora sp. PR83]|uniref:DUF5677 domain-containing protein n=1 Tax=Actinokineospora sp. PR83 TaxID=2884908 RepID=UPI001F3EF367|nr:DUF5677 domain-containing protein [Actinokineospora sp. PR83]MCG8914899.1 DUF5677 domain-containing protein [Actinokineospora sp. PR83]